MNSIAIASSIKNYFNYLSNNNEFIDKIDFINKTEFNGDLNKALELYYPNNNTKLYYTQYLNKILTTLNIDLLNRIHEQNMKTTIISGSNESIEIGIEVPAPRNGIDIYGGPDEQSAIRAPQSNVPIEENINSSIPVKPSLTFNHKMKKFLKSSLRTAGMVIVAGAVLYGGYVAVNMISAAANQAKHINQAAKDKKGYEQYLWEQDLLEQSKATKQAAIDKKGYEQYTWEQELLEQSNQHKIVKNEQLAQSIARDKILKEQMIINEMKQKRLNEIMLKSGRIGASITKLNNTGTIDVVWQDENKQTNQQNNDTKIETKIKISNNNSTNGLLAGPKPGPSPVIRPWTYVDPYIKPNNTIKRLTTADVVKNVPYSNTGGATVSFNDELQVKPAIQKPIKQNNHHLCRERVKNDDRERALNRDPRPLYEQFFGAVNTQTLIAAGIIVTPFVPIAAAPIALTYSALAGIGYLGKFLFG